MTIKLTPEELKVIEQCVVSQVRWGSGGCFGDGDEITQKKEYGIAKKLVKKWGYEII